MLPPDPLRPPSTARREYFARILHRNSKPPQSRTSPISLPYSHLLGVISYLVRRDDKLVMLKAGYSITNE